MSNKKRKPMSELPTMRTIEKTVIQQTTVNALSHCESVSITIPFITESPEAAGYQDEAHRVDMGRLTRERMRKVKALRRGLVANDVRMFDGAEVRTNRDAIFCLLDMMDI